MIHLARFLMIFCVIAPGAAAAASPGPDPAIIDQDSPDAMHFAMKYRAIYHALPGDISPESLPAPSELTLRADRNGLTVHRG